MTKDSSLKTDTANSEDSFTLESEAKEAKLPTINESWYTYWGLGAAVIRYPSEIQGLLDQLKSISTSHTSIAMDLFGFYWPLASKQTMMGFVINGVSDHYEVPSGEANLDQYLYSFSTMKFFGPNIGSEWFLRGDVGIAKYLVEAKGSGVSLRGSSRSGIGFLVGGGYAWAIGTETRMLLNLNFAQRNAESLKFSTSSLTLGFLF